MEYAKHEQGKQQSLFLNKCLTWQHAWIIVDHVEYGTQKYELWEKNAMNT